MKTVALFNSKGGSGKSTLAMHLAVAAQGRLSGETVLLDADPNGTATAWNAARARETPRVLSTSRIRLRRDLAALRGLGTALAILDCPPTITAESGFLVACADLVVVPVQPTMPDVAGCFNALEIVRAQRVPYVFLLSRCPYSGPERRETAAALAAAGSVCPVTIGDRIAFSRALKLGAAVTEYEPDSRAADEIRAACDWIFNQLDRRETPDA